VEALRLTIEPWRVYRPAVEDSHHFDKDPDLDRDPYRSEKLDPDPHKLVPAPTRIKVIRISKLL
jgi:hypothetical protein